MFTKLLSLLARVSTCWRRRHLLDIFHPDILPQKCLLAGVHRCHLLHISPRYSTTKMSTCWCRCHLLHISPRYSTTKMSTCWCRCHLLHISPRYSTTKMSTCWRRRHLLDISSRYYTTKMSTCWRRRHLLDILNPDILPLKCLLAGADVPF
jgi:hypothetical protein